MTDAQAKFTGETELEAERKYLDYARACLTHSREKILEMAERAKKTADDEMVMWLLRRARQLEDDDQSPLFFGRMDGDDIGRVYVGRRHVSDPDRDDETVVTDWRTKLAGHFYRANQADPMGVARRRRFGFSDDNTLTGFDDERVSEDEDGLSKIVLNEIERAHFGPMRDIVATIQPDQDEIVRTQLDDTLIIQGGPGTGKTAVGLHRAAYLLFEYEKLRRSGVLVIGPNDIFVRYIGKVLPTLGESDVVHTSLDQLVTGRRTPISEDPEVARLKGDARMAAVIERAMWSRVSLPADDLVVRDTSPFVRVAPEKIAGLVAELIESRMPWERARSHMVERTVGHVRRNLELRGRALSDSEMRRVSRTKTLRAAATGIWPEVKPEHVLFELLSDTATLTAGAAGILSPDEQRRIVWEDAPTTASRARWSLADLYLLDEIRSHIVGPPRYGHVVLDEAQDLLPMQLRAIARRCLNSATVLGDMAQRTTAWAAGTWEAVCEHLGLRSRILTLSTSYRVPAEVLAMANRLLPQIAPELPQARSARRAAGSFESVIVPDVPRSLAERVQGHAKRESVGVVVSDEHHAKFRHSLSNLGVELVLPHEEDTAHRVSLVSASLAKGLEFDHVFVIEPAEIVNSSSDGTRLLYIALTRAISRLTVLHSKPLPEVLRVAHDA
jgi:DNA helicase IV